MNRAEILLKASQAVKDRQEYGSPVDNFTITAALWTIILGVDVKPYQVALCQDAFKTARLLGKPNDKDSWVDKAGYAACGAEVVK